ncbi:hypothetical protein [Nonomuraea basaltis]|uniref:hypothetical protein n=1 Tax=Nonomuraea basaltis TaxID=2495887 RepID=UPI00110C4B4C|nr:hypothetical protein [Nonomuraea basaltis]TMR97713.1 hypothetical protein EJK15_16895 [Nonomuraea basaltis]
MSDMFRGIGLCVATVGLAATMAGGVMASTASAATATEWRLHGVYSYYSTCASAGKTAVRKKNSLYSGYKCRYNSTTTFSKKYWLYVSPKGIGVKG